MDTLKTCHTIVIILDNLISLVGFVISIINNMYPSVIGGWADKTMKVAQKKIRVVRKNTKRILMPEYSLLFQFGWTRDKFVELLSFLTNDTGDGGSTLSNVVGSANQEPCDMDTHQNSTMFGLFETIQNNLNDGDIQEDSSDMKALAVKIIMSVIFGFVAFFSF